MRRWSWAVVGVSVPLVVWAAVSVAAGPGASSGPVIAVDGWNAYPAGEVSGRLSLSGGCLYVGDAAVFWADGTTWDPARNAVVFDGADPVLVGQVFDGGGGHYSGDQLEGLDGLDVDAVTACLRRAGTEEAVVATPRS